MRLYVNNQLIIDNFTNHSSTENSGTIRLGAGQNYPIRMEYYESTGDAVAMLSWSSTATPKAVPRSQLFSGAVPAAPSGLTATPASATQVNLAWQDNSSNESGLRDQCKTGADGTSAQVAQAGPDEKTYMDTALNAVTTYVYRVRRQLRRRFALFQRGDRHASQRHQHPVQCPGDAGDDPQPASQLAGQCHQRRWAAPLPQEIGK